MAFMNKITPCLWFDTQAEDAATFYVSIFDDSGIDSISHYGKEGFELHGRPEGLVLIVGFRLAGQSFTALNGGPQVTFNDAISLQVFCETQDEVDYFWNRLSEGGEERWCGWLKDKFGVSWQIVPTVLLDMLWDPDTKKSQQVMKAYMQMQKFDIAALKRAFDGA